MTSFKNSWPNTCFPKRNLVSLSASQGPGDGHSLVGTQPFCGIELQRDGEVGAVTAEWLRVGGTWAVFPTIWIWLALSGQQGRVSFPPTSNVI